MGDTCSGFVISRNLANRYSSAGSSVIVELYATSLLKPGAVSFVTLSISCLPDKSTRSL